MKVGIGCLSIQNVLKDGGQISGPICFQIDDLTG